MLHLAAVILFTFAADCTAQDRARAAASRALDYLAVEVPKWKRENGCYSCHNNGDAARALMAGERREAVNDTLAWLRKPGEWDDQQTDAPFRDRRLARIQFSLALAEAWERGFITSRETVQSAGKALAQLQGKDGEWFIDQGGAVGSPATYGTALGTYAAMRLMKAAGMQPEFRAGAKWLREAKATTTVDQAARILGLRLAGETADAAALVGAQTKDGGWGPYRNTPPEAFDTAIAVLALRAAGMQAAAERGVEWLIREQGTDGAWPGTTRPSGGASYAQQISTTGWALLALLER